MGFLLDTHLLLWIPCRQKRLSDIARDLLEPVTTVAYFSTVSFIEIARDPFDRLLVSQAITENLKLLTMDKTPTEYSTDVRYVG